jgi:hypothetical protein
MAWNLLKKYNDIILGSNIMVKNNRLSEHLQNTIEKSQ